MNKIFIALSLLALSACGRMETYRFPLSRSTGVVSATPPAVFMEGQNPAAPAEELAMVEAVGYGNQSGMGDVIHALQEEGRRWNATAIVRVRIDCGYNICHGWGVAVKLAQ